MTPYQQGYNDGLYGRPSNNLFSDPEDRRLYDTGYSWGKYDYAQAQEDLEPSFNAFAQDLDDE